MEYVYFNGFRGGLIMSASPYEEELTEKVEEKIEEAQEVVGAELNLSKRGPSVLGVSLSIGGVPVKEGVLPLVGGGLNRPLAEKLAEMVAGAAKARGVRLTLRVRVRVPLTRAEFALLERAFTARAGPGRPFEFVALLT